MSGCRLFVKRNAREIGIFAIIRGVMLPFSLASADRDADRYGRKLRIVMRHGASIGEELVAEGLAREWDGARHSWCARS
ncbi:hypothetical protein BH09PSE3_BH09PSE3_04780 [soil metagenome]